MQESAREVLIERLGHEATLLATVCCSQWKQFVAGVEKNISLPYNRTVGDLVSKETVCCVGGKVKH